MLFSEYANTIHSVVLGDQEITLPEFVAVCRYHARVELSNGYKMRITASRNALEARLAEKSPIYGVNTGFGGNVGIAVDDEHLEQLQYNILTSHACAMGEPLTKEQVRAMLLEMLISVGHGYSAVSLCLMERARDFLNLDIVPYVPAEGSVGGLSFTTYLSMALIGKGRVIDQGQIVPTEEIFARYHFEPIPLGPREGLGITTTMAPQVGFSMLALYDAVITVRHADICCALVCEALRCTDMLFHEDLLKLKPHPEVIATAEWMRNVLKDSAIMEKARYAKVQDCVAARLIPHMLGAFKHMVADFYDILMCEVHGVIDNPVFLEDGTALMGSNFDSSYLAIYADSLCVASVNLVKMINTFTKRLVDTRHSGVAPYLVENPGLNSGFMMVQYVVEGLSADIAQMSNPATAFYTATSAGQEGPNPLSDNAARKTAVCIRKLQGAVSMTMLSALQALDFNDDPSSPVLQAIRKKARETVTFMERDDVMYERTEAMSRLVDSCELLGLMKNLIGGFTL